MVVVDIGQPALFGAPISIIWPYLFCPAAELIITFLSTYDRVVVKISCVQEGNILRNKGDQDTENDRKKIRGNYRWMVWCTQKKSERKKVAEAIKLCSCPPNMTLLVSDNQGFRFIFTQHAFVSHCLSTGWIHIFCLCGSWPRRPPPVPPRGACMKTTRQEDT